MRQSEKLRAKQLRKSLSELEEQKEISRENEKSWSRENETTIFFKSSCS